MSPPARLLDITRLSRRIGRVFTGVDRVELAYLRAVVADDVPAFGITRTALGYVLLDQVGLTQFISSIDEEDFPKPDFISRFNKRLDPATKIGQSLLRSLSVSRCRRSRLKNMLQDVLPRGFAYLNVGHSNLTERMLSALNGLPDTRVSVLVHDTIPLDYPAYQRPGSVAEFEAKLRRVATYADLVICISRAGAADVSRHMAHFGRVPDVASAHLGIAVTAPGSLPDGIPADRPYFVTIGTIEPRKNHALLLDMWETMSPDAPRLFVCGPRGWANDAVLDRLDRGVPQVSVYHDLSDPEISALIAGADGLLFPTFAEGFGLPPHEALALGTPVVCSDLPVLRETLGPHAIFRDPNDLSGWLDAVTRLAGTKGQQNGHKIAPLTWEAHFKNVFTMT